MVADQIILTDKQVIPLTRRWGAGWCSCVAKAIANITPERLAQYCRNRGFKGIPDPIYDDTDKSTRYQYVVKKEYVRKKDGDGFDEVPIVAKFGSFPHHPVNTMDTCLEAITVIGRALGEDPQIIVEEISTMPDVEEKEKA